MLRNTLLAAILVGIVVSIGFTLLNYLPVNRLLRLFGKESKLRSGDEYALIYKHIQDSDVRIAGLHTDVARLQTQLRASLFVRLLSGTVLTTNETELSWKLLPQMKEKNYLALIKVDTPEDVELVQTASFDFLKLLEKGGGYLQQTDYDTMVAILPAREEQLQRLLELIRQENAHLERTGRNLCAGVSEPFVGMENTSVAYHQASVALDSRQIMTRFTAGKEEAGRPFLNLTTLQRLYELTVAGEGDAAEDIVQSIGQELSRTSAGKDQQIEYCSLIRFTLELVIDDLRIRETAKPLTALQQLTHMDLKQMVDALGKDAQAISSQVREMKQKAGEETREQVMEYIRENFRSPTIYAESIAKANDVSVNAVYRFARESTGRSLGDYIESLRLDMACKLLESTDKTVMEIASDCGWTVLATFYRVFKQNIGVPPAQYRKQQKNKLKSVK